MKDDRSFKVTDRRVFDSEGEVKDPEALKDPASNTEPAPPREEKRKQKASEKPRETFPGNVDFATFVTSMYTSGAMHLGLIPNPVTGKPDTDTDLARQDISILEMLEEKTRGNLDDQESKILENALYDLRMKYVELSKKRD